MKLYHNFLTAIGLLLSASALAEIPYLNGTWKGEARISAEDGSQETCAVTYEINFIENASYTFSSDFKCDQFLHAKAGQYTKVEDEYVWQEGSDKGALSQIEEMNRINHAYLSDDTKSIYTYMIDYGDVREGVLGIHLYLIDGESKMKQATGLLTKAD